MMGTLSLLPLSPPRLLLRRERVVSAAPSLSFFKPSTIHPSPARLPLLRCGDETSLDESQFLDEDGVVQDMNGYLNYLSLEYDSVWDTKPSWCQPWTIVLTGVAVTVCSWIFLHSAVISAVVFSLICAWWYIFLYAYPKAYSDMIDERRKNVTSGIEDTFGQRKA